MVHLDLTQKKRLTEFLQQGEDLLALGAEILKKNMQTLYCSNRGLRGFFLLPQLFMIHLGFILHYLWVKDEQEGLLGISGAEGEGRFLFSVKGSHQIVSKHLHTYTALLQQPVSTLQYNTLRGLLLLRLKTTIMLAFSTFLTSRTK